MNMLKLFISIISLTFYISAFAVEPIQPIPVIPYDKEKAALGKLLFSDVRLSVDDTISCESCHFLDKAGVDHVAKSIGVKGSINKRNSPTVFNSAFNFRQQWDGRASDLEQQIDMAMLNPRVMGMGSWKAVIKKVSSIDTYKERFKAIYGTEITAEQIQETIAEFERTLVTVNSPFDLYLKGDETAISEGAKRGYKLFKSYGCSSCHQGVNVGGNMFQKFGVLKDINLRGQLNIDLGRHNVTGNEWDKRVFKVPSLRFAVHTAPYFHDGSVKTLREAIDIMTEFQLGRKVPDEHKNAIMEFLATLPGELPEGAK